MTLAVDDEPRALGMDPRLRQRRIEVRRAEGRRRLRRLLLGVGVVAALALLWALTYSSLLDVDHLEVKGALAPPQADAVREAVDIDIGAPIVYLDSAAASARVEALPWVESARVHRSLPGTVRVQVVERQAVVAAPTPEGAWRLLDVEGHAIADVPAPPIGVLALLGLLPPPEVGTAAGEDERAAISAATMLPAELRQRVGAVAFAEDGTVELRLAPSGVVRLGLPVDLPAKYLSALAVLDELGPAAAIGVLDVRAPRAPVLVPA
jgi:cell division protein FtsQ